MKCQRSFLHYLTVQVLLLIAGCFVVAYCSVNRWWYGLFLVPLIVYQCYRLVVWNKKIVREFHQLVETVFYRDFSRRFNAQDQPPYIQEIREGANLICETISTINHDKEIHYLHLQTILDLVDTGILSYQIQSGDVVWMNQSLKNLLRIPYLKNFHTLGQHNPTLYKSLLDLDHGKRNVLTIVNEQNQSSVHVVSSLFVVQNVECRLLAVYDVKKILDEAESKAWHRLLNVMTHEIMNSIGPIASLAEPLNNIVIKAKETSDCSAFEDIGLGIDTIMRRSKGLLSFAETYRNLSKITKLDIAQIHVDQLFGHISRLMRPSMIQKNIRLEIMLIDPKVIIDADKSLLEQMLINLILNAIEAVKHTTEPLIILSATLENGSPVIQVIDNGKGIPDELVDKIFVPFFSTREQGNGIGLSLCKQIMMLHNGTIRMNTIVNKGTCFTLSFE